MKMNLSAYPSSKRHLEILLGVNMVDVREWISTITEAMLRPVMIAMYARRKWYVRIDV